MGEVVERSETGEGQLPTEHIGFITPCEVGEGKLRQTTSRKTPVARCAVHHIPRIQ